MVKSGHRRQPGSEVGWALLPELGERARGKRHAHRPTKHRAVRSRHVPINQGLQCRRLVCGLSVARGCFFPLAGILFFF